MNTKSKKERRHHWTDVPNPKCRLCKRGKFHTLAQHKLSVKRYDETHSIFGNWVVEIRGIK